jgi:hypothetical protein
VCSGGHCGTAIDGGTCPLDPGGTPCSQCIVYSCCDQTQKCLNNPSCASAMSCYQSCVIGGQTPAQCQTNCCKNNACTTWTSCVTTYCSTQCYP